MNQSLVQVNTSADGRPETTAGETAGTSGGTGSAGGGTEEGERREEETSV